MTFTISKWLKKYYFRGRVDEYLEKIDSAFSKGDIDTARWVGENDNGAPKMQNNFWWTSKLLIFTILR